MSTFARLPNPVKIKDRETRIFLESIVRILEQFIMDQQNKKVKLANIPVFADTAAAVAGGLGESELFQDSSGSVHVVKVV